MHSETAQPARTEPAASHPVALARSTSRLRAIPVSAILPNPRNPRTRFSRRSIEELARSLAEDGQLQPVLVRPIVGSDAEGAELTYELIAGERRWRAAQLAGLNRIQAMLWDVSDEESLRLAIVENWHRENLTPAEEVAGLDMLAEAAGQVGVRELARRLRVAPSTISERLHVRRDPVVWPAVEAGDIRLSHAFHLRRAPVATRPALLGRLLREHPTREVLDTWIREARQAQPTPAAAATDADPLRATEAPGAFGQDALLNRGGAETLPARATFPLPPPGVRPSNSASQTAAAQAYLDVLETGLDPEARGIARHVYARLRELLAVQERRSRPWAQRAVSTFLGRE